MKVVDPVCAGLDVHKTFIVTTIITTESNELQPSYKKQRFSTHNNQILAMKQWLLDNNCHDICMESTGKYWMPIFNLLEDELNVTVWNPKWVKAIKGNKDDVTDFKWIGELFRIGLVPGSFIPKKDFRVLREFTCYRAKLTYQRPVRKIDYRMPLQLPMSLWILLSPICSVNLLRKYAIILFQRPNLTVFLMSS